MLLEMSRMKRVRFSDSESVPGMNSKSDDSLTWECRRTFAQSSDEPKTSEYKNYKKLRAQMGQRVDPSLPHAHENYSKTFEVSDSVGGSRLLMPVPMRMPMPCGLSKKEVTMSLTPVEKVTSIDLKSSFLLPQSSRKEVQYRHEDIFSTKRQALLRLAAETLLTEVDQLSLKGSDLISEFLQRLGIESNGIYVNRAYSEPNEEKLKIKSLFSVSPESGSLSEELPPQRMNAMVPTARYHIIKDFPEWCYGENKFPILPQGCVDSLSLSADHAHPTGLQYKRWPGCVPEDNKNIYLHASNTLDVDLLTDFFLAGNECLTLENMSPGFDCSGPEALPLCWHTPKSSDISLETSNLAELNKFDSRNARFARELSTLQFLNFNDDTKNEPVLSMIPYNEVANLCTRPTLLEDDHSWDFNSQVHVRGLCPSFIFPIQSSRNLSLSCETFMDCFPISAAEIDMFQERERDYEVDESDDLPLTLAQTQTHLVLTEGPALSDSYKGDQIFVVASPQRRSSIDDLEEEFHLNLNEILLSTGPEMEFRKRYFSSADYCARLKFQWCQDKFRHTDLQTHFKSNASSSGFEFSPIKERVLPLLLGKPNWYEIEEV